MSFRLNARIAELQSSLRKQEEEQRSQNQMQRQQQLQQIASAPVQLTAATASGSGATVEGKTDCVRPTAGAVETMSADSREGERDELELDEEGVGGKEKRSTKRSRSSSCTRISSNEAAAAQKKIRAEVPAAAVSKAPEPPQGSHVPPPPSPPPALLSNSSSSCPVCRESPYGLMVRSNDLLFPFDFVPFISVTCLCLSVHHLSLFVCLSFHFVHYRCGAALAGKVTTRRARGKVADAGQLMVRLFVNSALNRSPLGAPGKEVFFNRIGSIMRSA